MLSESFIYVALEEETAGERVYNLSLLLAAWAISYICGMLNVDVDALDACEDEAVKDWYNKSIRRDQGGLNRAINKRTVRKERVPGGLLRLSHSVGRGPSSIPNYIHTSRHQSPHSSCIITPRLSVHFIISQILKVCLRLVHPQGTSFNDNNGCSETIVHNEENQTSIQSQAQPSISGL